MHISGFSYRSLGKKNLSLKQPSLEEEKGEEAPFFDRLNNHDLLNASEKEFDPPLNESQHAPQAQQPSQDQQNVNSDPTTPEFYIKQRASQFKNALAKKNKKDFVLLLSQVENLNKLSIKDVFGAIGVKNKEEQKTAISKLFDSLFIPKDDSLSQALDLILDSGESSENQQKITLAITFLCNQFKAFNGIEDEDSAAVYDAEVLQEQTEKILSMDENELKAKQNELAKKQIELIFHCRDMYYIYNKDEHSLTPRFNKSNSSSLISIINGQESSLKQVYKSIKGVKSLDQDKLYSSMDTLGLVIATNFATDIGPFTDAVVGHHEGVANSVAQDEKGLLYNAACFFAATFLSVFWKSRGRNPEKYLNNLAKIITKSLNKSVNMYKQIEVDEEFNAVNSLEFSARLKKYNTKMNNPYLFKLKKIFKLNLFPRSSSRFLFSPYVLGVKSVKPVLNQTRSEQNRFHPSLQFDKVSQLKNTILRFEQTRDISSFLKELSTHEFLQDEKFIHDTVFKLKYKSRNCRGNIIQQLTNIYRRSSDIYLEQKKNFRELIQNLNRTGKTSSEKVLDANKKVILKTNWQNRVKACLSAHQVSLNILNSELISTGDKKFIFKCLIEDLKDKENGPMAGVCARRNKAAFEFGVTAVAYHSFVVRRYLPLLSHAGLSNSDAAKAVFGEVGWFLYAFLSSLNTLLANAETTTQRSILSSFEGSLQLLEDEKPKPISAAKPSLDSSTKEILSILNNKDNQNEIKPKAAKKLLKILGDLTSEQEVDSASIKFILEHKHGLKKPLLFEILKRLPDKSDHKENLLKMYFTKEDFLNSFKEDEQNRGKNDFDKFNQFLTSGIEQTKSSKNQTAFFVLQAKAYLLHLHSEIDENDVNYSAKLDLYEACKKRLSEVVSNTRKDQYSEFQALRKRSLSSSFWLQSFVKSIGYLAWAFACFMSSSAATAGIIGLCIGTSIALPGVGLAAAIVILLTFGIFRTLTSVVSSDHPYMGYTNTNTFEFIKKELGISEEVHHKAVRNSTKEMNEDLRGYLKSTNDNPQEIYSQVSAKLKEQVIGVFGCNLDEEKINLIKQEASQAEKSQLFKKIKEDILAQSVDKETILASLLRVIFIINESDLESSEKLKEFETLFKDIFEGKGGFAKLRMEQDYYRQKNWFVPQVVLGGLYGLAPLSTVLHQADWAQALMGTAGDVGPTFANGSTRFSSPQGNTESFQQSILLLKNVITSLLVSEKTKQEIKNEDNLRGLLNQKTSRVKTLRSKTTSTQILEKLMSKAPAPRLTPV